MQNQESNHQPSGFRKILKERGYYILLALCVLAVGISGYVFVSSAVRQNQASQETLSVPVTAQDPEKDTKPSDTKKPTTANTTPTEPSASTSAPAEEETADAPVSIQSETTVAPVSGQVIGDYAMESLTYNATTQDWRVHNGVDLAAAEGENVVAARSGTVTAVYEDESYGYTVVIQHDDGYTTHSCNLAESVAVSAGQTVAAGDVIGTVGRTAILEVGAEPHLHFAVYCDGVPVDPAAFLS